jgi:hypothetical protein
VDTVQNNATLMRRYTITCIQCIISFLQKSNTFWYANVKSGKYQGNHESEVRVKTVPLIALFVVLALLLIASGCTQPSSTAVPSIPEKAVNVNTTTDETMVAFVNEAIT